MLKSNMLLDATRILISYCMPPIASPLKLVVSMLAKWRAWVDVWGFETSTICVVGLCKIFRHFYFKSPPWKHSSYSNIVKNWSMLNKCPSSHYHSTTAILFGKWSKRLVSFFPDHRHINIVISIDINKAFNAYLSW